jgi:glycine/serine hydroxymethyltransferase
MRIRELLDQEKKDQEKAKAAGLEPPVAKAGVTPYIRPLKMADMRHALEKVYAQIWKDICAIADIFVN